MLEDMMRVYYDYCPLSFLYKQVKMKQGRKKSCCHINVCVVCKFKGGCYYSFKVYQTPIPKKSITWHISRSGDFRHTIPMIKKTYKAKTSSKGG